MDSISIILQGFNFHEFGLYHEILEIQKSLENFQLYSIVFAQGTVTKDDQCVSR